MGTPSSHFFNTLLDHDWPLNPDFIEYFCAGGRRRAHQNAAFRRFRLALRLALEGESKQRERAFNNHEECHQRVMP